MEIVTLILPRKGGGWDGGMLRGKARELRNNPTDAEQALWRHLRMRQVGGYRFRRQQPIGPYIVDFGCLEKRLVIEVDGGQHSDRESGDASRTAWLNKQGYKVLRFWDNEVLQNAEVVAESILMALKPLPRSYLTREEKGDSATPHLNPPPQGGRRSEKALHSTPSPLVGEGWDGGLPPTSILPRKGGGGWK